MMIPWRWLQSTAGPRAKRLLSDTICLFFRYLEASFEEKWDAVARMIANNEFDEIQKYEELGKEIALGEKSSRTSILRVSMLTQQLIGLQGMCLLASLMRCSMTLRQTDDISRRLSKWCATSAASTSTNASRHTATVCCGHQWTGPSRAFTCRESRPIHLLQPQIISQSTLDIGWPFRSP